MGTHSGDTLAILFTDVEGSTELLSRQGDELAGEILRIHEDLVRQQLVAWRGREMSFRGDAFLATFVSPPDAVHCGVEIQRALAAHNRTDPARRVIVRIGVHYGEVTEQAGQLYGQAVHAAARVMSEAAGSEVFVSADVREACRDDGFIFVDRGLFWLKGFPERWRLYEVAWRSLLATAELPTLRSRGPSPFVSRDVERADVRMAVRSTIGGHGRLVFVAGEAGVGKTRLTQEVAAEAEARAMRVFVGHCVQMEGGTPYLPFIEILEAALLGPKSPIELQDALEEDAGEIARLIPGLRRVLPSIPPPLDLPSEQARRYLWTSVESFLRRAAHERPLLLVLEDLHWADDSSLQLLDHLAGTLETMPVMILGTYRDGEVLSTHPLSRLLAELSRQRLAQRIPLGRISEGAVAAMIGGLSGQKPPPGLARAIHEVTEGNPFFVQEVFLHLSESGALVDEKGRFRRDLKVGKIAVPDSVRLVVGERLARLSDPTRDALAAAAVVGRVFDSRVVAHVADLDVDDLTAALDEAESARVVAPSRGDSSRLGFVHELIRQTILSETTSSKRQRLHARTAEAIERLDADHVDDHAEELAYHLTNSGTGVDPVRLGRYLRVAGDRAVEAAAFDDGLSHFEQALALVPKGDDQSRVELLERVALAQRSLGHWKEAVGTMDKALELDQRLGRTEAFGKLCWAMAYQLAWGARFEEAVGLAQRGLAVLGDLANPERARLLSVTGWVVGLTGDHANASQLFAGARALAEGLGDRRALADVLHMQTAHHLSFGEFTQGAESGMKAARVFEDEGALWDLCSVLAFVGYELGTTTRQKEAAEHTARAAALATRLGHLGACFLSLAHRARSEGLLVGDLTKTAQLGREQIDVCVRANLPWLYVGHLFLGFAAHWAGNWEDAERELRRAVELEPEAAFAGQCAIHLALHLAEMGRDAEALEIIERSRARFPVPGRAATLGSWGVLLGATEALFLLGRYDEVAALHPRLLEAVSMGEWLSFDCRLVQPRAGIAAAAAGKWEEAERHFNAAAQLADDLGHRSERAAIYRLRAMALNLRADPDDEDEANVLIARSAALYRQIGMDRMAELVEGMAERVSRGAGRVAPLTGSVEAAPSERQPVAGT